MDIDILNKDYSDDDIDVWEYVYKKAYCNKIIGNEFDINNPYPIKYEKSGKVYTRYIADSRTHTNDTISGETDFNFSKKPGLHRQSKYGTYKKIIDKISDKQTRQKYLELLEYCSVMTHKVCNYSLMQRTGSLQTIKGTYTLTDRIDTFIFLLNEYYMGRSEMALFHCSAELVTELIYYLELFRVTGNPKESIYKYCEEVYHIRNRHLVKALIKSGCKIISEPDELLDYMILAVNFWNAKSNYYYKQAGISDKWILRLIRREDY